MRTTGPKWEIEPVTGAVWCGDIDLDEFRRDNRAPLYPMAWNRWLLARTERDNPTKGDVVRTVQAVMSKFFDDVPLPDTDIPIDTPGSRAGEDTGKIDHVRVLSATRDLTQAVAAVTDSGWRGSKRREQLKFAPTLRKPESRPGFPDPAPWYVAIEFYYRGSQASLSWPVHKVQMINAACPIEADWLLMAAYQHQSGASPEKSPPDTEFWEELFKEADKKLPSVPTVGIGLLVGGLAVFGALTVYNTFRPR
jgi:hypothetical protein